MLVRKIHKFHFCIWPSVTMKKVVTERNYIHYKNIFKIKSSITLFNYLFPSFTDQVLKTYDLTTQAASVFIYIKN